MLLTSAEGVFTSHTCFAMQHESKNAQSHVAFPVKIRQAVYESQH